MSVTHALFEYCYRDASNYRAHEQVLLEGTVSPAIEDALRSTLIDRTWFVAEGVGLPTLYNRLQQYSGGSTADDHSWHEFVRLRAATAQEINSLPQVGSVEQLFKRFVEARIRAPHP